MKKHTLHSVLPSFTIGLWLAAPTAHAQLNLAVTPYASRALFQTGATNSNAPATNVVDFQDITYSPATGSDFIPAFTKAGFVTFNLNSNFRHEIIEGTNVGQAGNNVYTTLASNKTLPLADITFATGVLSLGFDFKDSAGNGSAGALPQTFTFTLYSGATSLGSMMSATTPPGTAFTFLGFTSTLPITEMVITSTGASPNQDVVLDNFAVASPVPEPGVSVFLAVGLLGLVASQRFLRRRHA